MSNEQPEALRLAERLEVTDVISDSGNKAIRKAAAELRRLTEVNQEMLTIIEQELEWVYECGEAESRFEWRTRLEAAIAKAKGESNER